MIRMNEDRKNPLLKYNISQGVQKTGKTGHLSKKLAISYNCDQNYVNLMFPPIQLYRNALLGMNQNTKNSFPCPLLTQGVYNVAKKAGFRLTNVK